jgi:ubiquinone biosynthesis protein
MYPSLGGNEKPDFNRLREILSVLRKYRFEKTLIRLGIQTGFKIPFLISDKEYELDSEAPERFRLALQDLGTTFIKLGQVLSTRPDLVGKEMADELTLLQDKLPPVSFESIKTVIEEDFGAPLEELFLDFDEECIASASIAQVHRAHLKDGTEVAVKVKKQGITERIKQDIVIMRYIAQQANKRVKSLKYYNVPAIVDEFERVIFKELNFSLEASNIERFRSIFEDDNRICAPKVYREQSTSRVLTMEYIHGVKISEALQSDMKVNGKVIAKLGTECYFKQIFEYGFFHADPHPGNIMVLPGNRLCFVDFGMTGALERDFRENLAELFIFTVKNDLRGLINQMMYMRLIDDDTDLDVFKYDIMDLLDRFFGAEIQDVGSIINEFSMPGIMVKNKIKLPRDFILLGRVLSMAEDLGRRLDPGFKGIEVAQPLIRKMISRRLNPLRLADYQTRYIFELEHLIKDLPETMNRIFLRLEDGRLNMQIQIKELHEFSNRMEKISNRISLSLIISALIIGSSLIMVSNKGMPMPGIGFSTIGVVIFLIGVILALLLFISLFRKL